MVRAKELLDFVLNNYLIFFSGNVYVKCPTVNTAVSAVNALHGRWFAGNVITAAYVPLVNYHNLFSDAAYATAPLATSRR